MIKTFRSQGAEDLYHGRSTREARKIPQVLWKIIFRKLDLLNAASNLADLRVPPANRLEALKGSLKGKYSIRVTDQYRMVFIFKDGHAYDVQVTDYH